MRRGGGKQKGAEFERTICKRLSLWLSYGKDDSLLWRSAMSGGRATLSLQKGKQAASQAGDISAISEEAYRFLTLFSIECKSYKTLHLHNLVFKGKAGLPEFWIQAARDAEAHKKLPLLVAKQNQYPPLICFNASGKFKLRCDIPSLVTWRYRNDLIYIYHFEDFISCVDPKNVLA